MTWGVGSRRSSASTSTARSSTASASGDRIVGDATATLKAARQSPRRHNIKRNAAPDAVAEIKALATKKVHERSTADHLSRGDAVLRCRRTASWR